MQVETKKRLYDLYINDNDLIGKWIRTPGAILCLSDYMKERPDLVDPYLDMGDIFPEFLDAGSDYQGNLYQFPFHNMPCLYWYRADLFEDPKERAAFKEKYGYELRPARNFQEYWDIAEFFTRPEEDLYGHMHFGKRELLTSIVMTDSFLGIVGIADPGVPEGVPVNDWGIRVDPKKNYDPVGCIVERGGATDSPAAEYGMKFYAALFDFAPEVAREMSVYEALVYPATGKIAQCYHMYTAFLALPEYSSKGPTVGKWKVTHPPHGKYWKPGMKTGYFDIGCWTIPAQSVTEGRREMAWIFSQFCCSKSLALEYALKCKMFERNSCVFSPEINALKGTWGGIIEFYQSEARKSFAPTSRNVPDYTACMACWYTEIADVVAGTKTPKEAVRAIGLAQEDVIDSLGYELNPKKSREYWLSQPGAPWPELPPEPWEKIANEKYGWG